MLNLVVLISGSGTNLKALLEGAKQQEAPYRVVAVFADCDAAGLAYAVEHGVKTRVIAPGEYPGRPEWGQALADAIEEEISGVSVSAGADWLIVSAGFMRILPRNFVDRFSPRIINTHPALLPKYPGAHAVRDALADGAHETGCTVHLIDHGVDTGAILRQGRITIGPEETESEVHERIKEIERPLLVQTVCEIARGDIDLKNLAASA